MNDDFVNEYIFCDDVICKDARILIDMLVPLVSSYRLLAGAADEFNKISLADKHDVKEAIERVDDLGDIIDDIQDELHKVMKLYLDEVDRKIRYGKDNNFLLNGFNNKYDKKDE